MRHKFQGFTQLDLGRANLPLVLQILTDIIDTTYRRLHIEGELDRMICEFTQIFMSRITAMASWARRMRKSLILCSKKYV